MPPATFDPNAPDLGLPPFPAASHALLYDAVPSAANVDEGGDGRYESLLHGTYSHHPAIVVLGRTFIVYWTNHSKDENGPGQRVLAHVGQFDEAFEEIDWSGRNALVEIIPPPIPVRRRPWNHDPDIVYPYGAGSLQLINGRLYTLGGIHACHGYTNNVKYHGHQTKPLPAADWSDNLDRDHGFVYDVWLDLGLSFAWRWKISGGTLVPDSPLYARSPLTTRFEVCDGRWKDVAPLLPPYTETVPFEQASDEMRNDILHGTPAVFERTPKYAPGTSRLTEDGTNGLAHQTQFRRRDGRWVVLRDNLECRGHYWAAMKEREQDDYPPSVETNLYGGAMPVAGELPSGRAWIICNSFDDYYNAADRSRKVMFITLSDDGVTFDKTYELLHVNREPDGGMYKFGGPQYYKALTVGKNIWIVYSITKEKVGVTKIPVEALERA
jgi:hypothetical protein